MMQDLLPLNQSNQLLASRPGTGSLMGHISSKTAKHSPNSKLVPRPKTSNKQDPNLHPYNSSATTASTTAGTGNHRTSGSMSGQPTKSLGEESAKRILKKAAVGGAGQKPKSSSRPSSGNKKRPQGGSNSS